MHTHIALLRGVTPTGKNRVPMAQLREALERHGFPGARTWIQSGNVILTTALAPDQTAQELRRIIRDEIGADLAVIVKTPEELRRVLAENPFTDLLSQRVFYAQWQGEVAPEKTAALGDMDFGEERLIITPRAAYMYIPGSAARSFTPLCGWLNRGGELHSRRLPAWMRYS